MAKMQAVLVDESKKGVDRLYLSEADKPEPQSGEIQVKIVAFGLNRMDISQRDGRYPVPPGASTILGVEFSGTISALGPNIDEGYWKIGDEVFGLAAGGAYAEYIVLKPETLLPKPKHLSWVEAASIPENWLTALQAIDLICHLKPGEDILIHAGASGVGIAAHQLAHVFGVRRIITTVSSQEKIDFLKSIPNGPTDCINYKTQNFAEEVKKITEGKGVNVAIDFIGKDYWEKNIESLGLDGRMVILGLMSGADIPAGASLGPIVRKRLTIMGSTLRSRSLEYQKALISRFADVALSKFGVSPENGGLKTYIHKVYPWHEIKDAHTEMESNKNSGKIIVEVK